MLAIHTLRGGIGASILAVNLAIGLRGLWNAPTLLMDLAMLAGQDALLLNLPLRRTWETLPTLLLRNWTLNFSSPSLYP